LNKKGKGFNRGEDVKMFDLNIITSSVDRDKMMQDRKGDREDSLEGPSKDRISQDSRKVTTELGLRIETGSSHVEITETPGINLTQETPQILGIFSILFRIQLTNNLN